MRIIGNLLSKVKIKGYKMFRFLLSLIGIICLGTSCIRDANGGGMPYPELEPDQKIKPYFGHKVIDDYQQLSDFEDPMVQNWFKAQDSLAETYFQENALYEEFQNR